MIIAAVDMKVDAPAPEAMERDQQPTLPPPARAGSADAAVRDGRGGQGLGKRVGEGIHADAARRFALPRCRGPVEAAAAGRRRLAAGGAPAAGLRLLFLLERAEQLRRAPNEAARRALGEVRAPSGTTSMVSRCRCACCPSPTRGRGAAAPRPAEESEKTDRGVIDRLCSYRM